MSDSVCIVERRPAPASAGPLVVLVGPMGAGKSTVGGHIAKILGVDFIDADRFIEDITQFSIPEMFDSWGEDYFRNVESRAVAHLLSTFKGVLALGGGAITRSHTRELLRDHLVVYLSVDRDHVADRISGGKGRPMLAGGDPTERWESVTASRQQAFADVAVWDVDTNSHEPRDIAAAVAHKAAKLHGLFTHIDAPATLAENEIARIPVGEDANRYDVVVGRNLIDSVAAALPEKCERVLIVHQGVMREAAEVLRQRIIARGREAFLAEIPDGEEAKTAQVLAFLWQVLGQADLTRSDLVIGMGGGAATDLAGFAAASWLRGIALIQVPTTVAGMVDAAVGGKTGINTAEGKNLVGAFYPPKAVFADVDFLATLPRFDVAAGLAEVVKAGFIADPEILRIVEADPENALDVSSPEFADIMVRAIRVKARVVSNDLTEQGLREILNYGHTFGHAIERNERYQWRHGAAVAVGMVFAAELAFLSGKMSEELVARHRSILSSLGLPITYRSGQWDALLEAMKRDKKARGALLRFVVLTDVAQPVRLEGPDPALLVAAYESVSSES